MKPCSPLGEGRQDRAEHRRALVAVLAHRPHPEQGFRTCLGILRLYRGIDPARAEAVSARAVEIGALTYKSIVSIITHKLDKKNSVEVDPRSDARLRSASRPTG